ncbi:hypothetical protein [Methylocaldum gracile]|jgi:hypothetical protein|uniref:hypothetical protein n=1 Tax=Methylocaldum sp. 0917 TaxID=2485163 RepID=UPI00105D54FF
MNQATVLYLINDAKKREIAQHQERMTVLDHMEQLVRSHFDQLLSLQEENSLLKQLADHDHDGFPFSDTLDAEGDNAFEFARS